MLITFKPLTVVPLTVMLLDGFAANAPRSVTVIVLSDPVAVGNVTVLFPDVVEVTGTYEPQADTVTAVPLENAESTGLATTRVVLTEPFVSNVFQPSPHTN